MKEIDFELCEKERKMKEEYERLFKEWEIVADKTKTDDDYNKTWPLFEKGLRAFEKWQKFYFSNGQKLRFEKLD